MKSKEDPRIKYFRQQLFSWHEHHNDRSYPWKQETDPYKIWLSEIILQQTRSDQGLPYYLSFTHHYPTIVDLANAEDEVVFRLWQGLGYYNRCKNLLFTARYIRDNYNGVFPSSYEDILSLKGIGAYTAAAIASFAYKSPYAVLDGNVFRVLARYNDIDTPIDTTIGKKLFEQLAQNYLDKEQPNIYNQAIMDLGAIVCMPKQPLCDQCPIQNNCLAYRNNTLAFLPVKSKKLVIKRRTFHFFILRYNDSVYIEKREDGDIWSSLHQPYLIEGDGDNNTLKHELKNRLNISIKELEPIAMINQKLTHQHITSHFYEVILNSVPLKINSKNFVPINSLKNFAFPKTIISFFDNKYYF